MKTKKKIIARLMTAGATALFSLEVAPVGDTSILLFVYGFSSIPAS
ncbi:MAG: hypothetical protein HDR27_03120 [Lachnospiraceae bacterium]|nr:hypothetical protein [Lachnospiraceae bacterium]